MSKHLDHCVAIVYNDAAHTTGVVRSPECPDCTPEQKCRVGIAVSVDSLFTKDEQRAMMLETIRELGLG